MEKKPTYCRLCEAGCGFIAEVEGNRIMKYYPDRDHPLSKGYCCVKGLEMINVQYHPKRIKYPLKRKGSSFEKISWDQAVDEAGTRLIELKEKYGPEAIGAYFGNPIAFSSSMAFYGGAFLRFLGSKNLFTAGSQDCNNKFAHSTLFLGLRPVFLALILIKSIIFWRWEQIPWTHISASAYSPGRITGSKKWKKEDVKLYGSTPGKQNQPKNSENMFLFVRIRIFFSCLA